MDWFSSDISNFDHNAHSVYELVLRITKYLQHPCLVLQPSYPTLYLTCRCCCFLQNEPIVRDNGLFRGSSTLPSTPPILHPHPTTHVAAIVLRV
ncbi:uncharacterized protein CLUP02_00297 [Colletotrichum lupini]|uniref:Uncharacterized protein n=1 Tax=Colletotrichum lupini TaxID=145971 RepID=A0A9Q8SBV8_9PEZI|nr:uncharacterized protein CLUP02_00297 [Colletotrichum lupini]UQC73652.1 hypothetical protein CLUP02_00297 [Colletotrichum lupini]